MQGAVRGSTKLPLLSQKLADCMPGAVGHLVCSFAGGRGGVLPHLHVPRPPTSVGTSPLTQSFTLQTEYLL